MSDDLTAFLRDRYADEALLADGARHEASGRWKPSRTNDGGGVEYADGPDDWPEAASSGIVVYDEGSPTREQAEHIAYWNPRRALDEVDAKRRVLDEIDEHWDDANPIGGRGSQFLPQEWKRVLKALAQSYGSHPAFRDDWEIT